MRILVGDYEFSLANRNAAWFQESRTPALTPFGQRSHYNYVLVLESTFIRDSQSELTSALAEMEAAVRSNAIDVRVLDNSGGETVHVLRNADTLNGVRVGIQYPAGRSGLWGGRTEYVYMRTVRLVMRAEILDSENETVSYHQSIKVFSGAFDFVIVETLGLPVRQELGHTRSVAIQSGYAEGLTGYPPFPLPLFTGLKPPPFQDMMTPKRFGSVRNTVYPIRWTYRFEHTTPMIPIPPPIYI